MSAPTQAEWQDALKKALGSSCDDGLTLKELARALGTSDRTATKRLDTLEQAGLLGCGWRTTTNRMGMRCRVPVYWIKKEKR